ncbi:MULTISPECIES: nicotinate-nucleotide adenylyltransferase [Prochlorococcus]|uniref:nicotinate-nucleotide adenylyltransferase n=1 Tax=Prochlorococcus marinus str. MIT 9116 TaxID=167544 RepID=A0A0A1ZWD8_PROMR|nr:nicotinate-nucleotide adenylyltransferase [Prochlorococcus marinus]KGF91184.1 Nicotinate-nucleotide adenylyltransferase bacterial NadD family [Prochlorococcus marinus str. MIT 9107]KGF92544.1 Nicotinate-nucleotide adenylyltransferase bacterial NadD family [Prochlorococcus marinus str. MIT 9116]KGF93786.1 Nicotinate-nucleotide adenylyltransferase bacterial NadD family [Prochlorococcus marinus str. MIT 9123]
MKKTVALFGTSADPPTIGHKKILEELSKIYAFTISYVSNNPNKKHKEDISIRSHLLKTLIEDLDNPKILFNQSVSSQWAIESIKNCKKIYEFNNLDFVIGSDLINDIFCWKNFDKINKEVSFFILKREGYPIESSTLKMLETCKVKFKISNIKIPNISSSKLRLNFNYSNLPTSLIDIVKKNNLYISSKLVE